MIIKIFTLLELIAALNGNTPATLELHASILSPVPITLPAGFNLTGADKERCVISFGNGGGIALTADNQISDLIIQTDPNSRAIYLAGTDIENIGTLTLENLTVTGQVQILTRGNTKTGRLIAENIDIVSCDSRKYPEQPQKYGVNVYQGAFTVYNYNSDPNSVIRASLSNIALGRKGAPVVGTGLFIGGFGDAGGRVLADTVTTGEVFTNGMIPFGQPNLITGAIFVLNGAEVGRMIQHGSVTTYGVNDMVLDAWGRVDEWTVEKPITSYGPSGIGFVNFGTVGKFEARDKIETFGLGARGFNQYDGTIDEARFHSIVTHGDGSIGIQVSKPVGTIAVTNGITTNGSVGQTLVKGVIMSLAADGVSVKPGGDIKELIVAGGITTHGDGVSSYHVEGGAVHKLTVAGDISATGLHSSAVYVSDGGQTPLDNIPAVSERGVAVRIENGTITEQTGLTTKPQ